MLTLYLIDFRNGLKSVWCNANSFKFQNGVKIYRTYIVWTVIKNLMNIRMLKIYDY